VTVRSSALSGLTSVSKPFALSRRVALGKRSLILGMSQSGRFAYNSASGGTLSTFTKNNTEIWNRHTFTTSGTLTVTRGTQPFTIFAVGGGGKGGAGFIGEIGYGGYSGGGGGAFNKTVSSFSAGATTITVGAGATSTSGGSSIALGLTVGGGGRGGHTGCPGNGFSSSPASGGTGSEGGTSNGGTGGGCSTGSTFPAVSLLSARGLSTSIGTGGAGTGQDSGGTPGANGTIGIVIVEYRIQ
jgi:hypothetical protein